MSSTQTRYVVVKRTLSGRRVGTVAGLGRNAGTWDADHTRRTAQRHAQQLRAEDQQHAYTDEPAY
jgi:hypothetical protein